MKVAVAAALVLALASAAHAQPDQAQAPEGKSPQTANALAWVGFATIAAPVLASLPLDMGSARDRHIALGMGAGEALLLTFGPSAGHWYAGEFITPGLGFRAGGVAAFTAGMVGLWHCAPADADCGRGGWGLTFGALTVGGVGLIVGTILDINDAGAAAHRYNHAHGLKAMVTPMVAPSTAGLTLAGRF